MAKKAKGAEQTAQETEQTAVNQPDPETERDETETEQTATEPQAQEAEQEETETERDLFADLPDPCVYCGPSVKNVARQYTTYQGGGIPDALKDFIKAHPAARGLITSAGKFAATRKRLETPGTAEAILYRTVKAEL